jgi:hypothetical protein
MNRIRHPREMTRLKWANEEQQGRSFDGRICRLHCPAVDTTWSIRYKGRTEGWRIILSEGVKSISWLWKEGELPPFRCRFGAKIPRLSPLRPTAVPSGPVTFNIFLHLACWTQFNWGRELDRSREQIETTEHRAMGGGTKCRLTIKVVLKTVGRASTTYNTFSYRTGILFWTRSIRILPKYPTRHPACSTQPRGSRIWNPPALLLPLRRICSRNLPGWNVFERKESSKSKNKGTY